MAGARNICCVLLQFFEPRKRFPLLEPALVAALTPVGEVLVSDGNAIEVPGEDCFDEGKFVKPWKDFRRRVAIFDAAVELVAEVFGKAGDFAGEGVLLFGVVGKC